MSDKRTSREIIWQHAFDYGWKRCQDINGNPGVDAFFAKAPEHYTDPPTLLVWYSRDGRRVTDASRNGYTLGRCNRDAVMDVLETER